jgi:hypothetical protein
VPSPRPRATSVRFLPLRTASARCACARTSTVFHCRSSPQLRLPHLHLSLISCCSYRAGVDDALQLLALIALLVLGSGFASGRCQSTSLTATGVHVWSY